MGAPLRVRAKKTQTHKKGLDLTVESFLRSIVMLITLSMSALLQWENDRWDIRRRK